MTVIVKVGPRSEITQLRKINGVILSNDSALRRDLYTLSHKAFRIFHTSLITLKYIQMAAAHAALMTKYLAWP